MGHRQDNRTLPQVSLDLYKSILLSRANHGPSQILPLGEGGGGVTSTNVWNWGLAPDKKGSNQIYSFVKMMSQEDLKSIKKCVN